MSGIPSFVELEQDVTKKSSLEGNNIRLKRWFDPFQSQSCDMEVRRMKLLGLILLSFLRTASCVITIENNGYKGLVIAIHNSVPEDENLIRNLQLLFTSASESLFKVTRNRAYFDEVTIIVPSNWTTRGEYQRAIGGNRFSVADVRIDQPNPTYGNNPYTVQAASCGKQGQYIHLTPEFVRELHGRTKEIFGNPAVTFVHEWSHYRYGIFDEYVDESDEQTKAFYIDEDNKIRPTGCTAGISGWLADEGQECTIGPDGLPDHNCEFFPDTENNKVSTSLMYLQYLPTMEGFCDDTEEFKHNSAGPNKQNILCGGQSTWSVVSQHPDFDQNNNPPQKNLRTQPNFRILQPKQNDTGHFVLVLDVSGSMSGRRIAMLHRAASRFVQNQIPDNSQLGIVTFSSVPHILANMTHVDRQSRHDLGTKLPKKDDEGNTAIGWGLEVAIKLLYDSIRTTKGAVIILISDGEENVSPHVEEVIPTILRSGVVINTIAFGNLASKQLEKLVRLTGGQGFFYSDEDIEHNHAVSLQAAFFAAASTQADVDLQPVELNNKIFDSDNNQDKKGKIVIDKAIGKNTQFVFLAAYPDTLQLTLTSPSGQIYGNKMKTIPDGVEFYEDNVTGSATFTVPMAQHGRWEYRIKTNETVPQSVGVSVTSEPRDIRDQPVRIRTWISDVEFRYPEDASEAKIFAEVKKKYTPILDATVIATVERPAGDYVDVELRDDGAGADINANDGIYSTYFTQFDGIGRYSVSARVINDGKARTRVKKNGKKKQGAVKVRKMNPKIGLSKSRTNFNTREFQASDKEYVPEYDETPVDEFERSLMAGAFSVEGWKAGKDEIAPNRIIDLRVESYSLENKTVSLSWTSPGDDMTDGLANKTEILFHTQRETLYEDLEKSFIIGENDIVNGTLIPVAPGKRHFVTVRVDRVHDDNLPGNTLYFAVRSIDEADNAGGISNVVQAHFTAPAAVPASQITLLIVAGIVGTLIFAIVVVVAFRSCKNRRYKRKQ